MLEVKNLQYCVKNCYLVQDIHLALKKKQCIAIVGPNGAGKSTLLSLLSQEISEKGNIILFKNRALEAWNSVELPKHKAKFSQQFHHDIPLSVQDVVMMGRYPYFHNQPTPKDEIAVAQALQDLGIEHLKTRAYPSLSGGEKQRTHLARVMAQLNNDVEEKLAFFDEPLNNLDVMHQHHIMKKIKNFVQHNNTALVVLHDLNMACEYADYIILMKNGKIHQQGTPENVFTNKTITEVYNFPCTICKHPINNNPLILFGS